MQLVQNISSHNIFTYLFDQNEEKEKGVVIEQGNRLHMLFNPQEERGKLLFSFRHNVLL